MEAIQRPEVKFVDKSEKFHFKKKDYKQYAHVYSARLRILGDLLKKKAQEKWGAKHPIKQLADLREENQEVCVIIGTLYKHQVLRPSILREVAEETSMLQEVHRSNYVDKNDKLILEDDLQRIRLLGKIDVHEVVTGIVCAVLGYVEGDGRFLVKDYIYYESGPQKPLKAIDSDQYIMLISGINLSPTTDLSNELDLIRFWLYGSFVMNSTEFDPVKILRVIIAGNSVKSDQSSAVSDDNTETFTAIQQLDTFFSDISQSIHIDLMPGETDPSNFMLPQQPLHACMFPKSRIRDTFNSVSNPYRFEIMDRHILGTSGQNTADIQRFSNIENDLIALKSTIHWSHIAPTAPDTLACYPYYEEDPFILTEKPHVYFSGNCKEFNTELIKTEDRSEIRLICIPAFSETKQVVLLNLRTLDCNAMKFDFSC